MRRIKLTPFIPPDESIFTVVAFPPAAGCCCPCCWLVALVDSPSEEAEEEAAVRGDGGRGAQASAACSKAWRRVSGGLLAGAGECRRECGVWAEGMRRSCRALKTSRGQGVGERGWRAAAGVWWWMERDVGRWCVWVLLVLGPLGWWWL